MGRKPRKEKKQNEKKNPIDETVIDVDSYDWGDLKLLNREKLFVIWYTMPFQNCWHDSTKAALKAGYAKPTAYNAYKKIKTEKKIQDAVKRLEQNIVKVKLQEVYQKAMDLKIKRAFYNVKDYYRASVYTDEETGATHTHTGIIPIDEISDDNAMLIDNVEVNASGIATYKLPAREREINDIIKFNNESENDKNNNDFDIETTVDIIKNNLAQIRTTVHANNEKVKKNAQNYIENSENQPDFD